MLNAAISTRVAAILLWINGVGFGLPCLLAIRNLMTGRDIPLIMGYKSYGGGPFERIGVYTTVPLVVAFLLVCVLEVVAGWSLWGGNRTGAILAVVLVPFGAVFWWGFALPFPPMFAALRTVLIITSWASLK